MPQLNHFFRDGFSALVHLTHLLVGGYFAEQFAHDAAAPLLPTTLQSLHLDHHMHMQAEYAQSLLDTLTKLKSLRELNLSMVAATCDWRPAAARTLTALVMLTSVRKERWAHDGEWRQLCIWMGPWLEALPRLKRLQLRAPPNDQKCEERWQTLAPQLANMTGLVEIKLDVECTSKHAQVSQMLRSKLSKLTALVSLQ